MDPSVQAAAVSSIGLVAVALLQLRTHKKVQETHHQVTTNSHSSKTPTVLDRLDDLSKKLDAHLEDHARGRD